MVILFNTSAISFCYSWVKSISVCICTRGKISNSYGQQQQATITKYLQNTLKTKSNSVEMMQLLMKRIPKSHGNQFVIVGETLAFYI